MDILRFNLQREGYQTAEAYDGEEGLEKARTADPDLNFAGRHAAENERL